MIVFVIGLVFGIALYTLSDYDTEERLAAWAFIGLGAGAVIAYVIVSFLEN